jgi:hypothetical protein
VVLGQHSGDEWIKKYESEAISFSWSRTGDNATAKRSIDWVLDSRKRERESEGTYYCLCLWARPRSGAQSAFLWNRPIKTKTTLFFLISHNWPTYKSLLGQLLEK